MNQRGFVNIALIILVVVLVGAGSYFVFVKKPADQPTPPEQTQARNNTQPTQPPANNQPSPTPKDETANWKTYRNENLGFEFKYPAQINGKPVSIVERKDYKDFLLFQSKIPYGSPTEGKGGELEQSYFTNQITFSAHKLSDFAYPEPQGKIYAPTLTVGVDLGGQGGYIYEPSKNRWHSRENLQQELTWEEMYKYFGSYLPTGMSVVKTLSGPNAFPYGGEAYESYWDGYRIFDTGHSLFLNFYHSYGYTPESVKVEVEKENKLIREFLQGISKTVKFF